MRWAPPSFFVSFYCAKRSFFIFVVIIKMPVQHIVILSEVKIFYLTFYFVSETLTSLF